MQDDGYHAVIEITAHIPIPDSTTAVRSLSPWVTTVLPCPDCGQTMIWAEQGYTSWPRSCESCGTHWSAAPTEMVEDRQRIVIERAKFA
jgi:predicted RNA-binding Zn-ribbon protein involved in translation (DUF1610 family)